MPTIDELPAATASASTDEIMCSQGGVSRKATVAQIIAAAQPLIALPQGTLLGRFDSGTGGVEPISVGPNLTLASGALSANAPFAAAGLPPAANPAPGDIVPLGQAGQNVGASYAQFMAGIATVAGINASAMVARATGSSATRTLANLFDDAVSPEDFGAAGDGLPMTRLRWRRHSAPASRCGWGRKLTPRAVNGRSPAPPRHCSACPARR